MIITGHTGVSHVKMPANKEIRGKNISYGNKPDSFEKTTPPAMPEGTETKTGKVKALLNKVLNVVKKVLYPVAFLVHKVISTVENIANRVTGIINKIKSRLEKRKLINDLIDKVKSHEITDGVFVRQKAEKLPANDITTYKFNANDKVITVSKIISRPSEDKSIPNINIARMMQVNKATNSSN